MQERYDRQTRVKGWNQELLRKASATIIGAGHLGSFVGTELACLGVGRLDIYDSDVVEETNLNRQFLYRKHVGEEKAEALVGELRAINPGIVVEAWPETITDENISLIGTPSVIMDCLDNYATRAVLNSYAVKKKVPLVSGATGATNGRVVAYVPGKTLCMDCQLEIYASAKDDRERRSCNREPNPAVVTTGAIIASLMADEARKIIAPLPGESPLSVILKYDSARPERFYRVSKERKAGCGC
jgi:molybdopterin/thiamine biosynthesis adenylyltransferase